MIRARFTSCVLLLLLNATVSPTTFAQKPEKADDKADATKKDANEEEPFDLPVGIPKPLTKIQGDFQFTEGPTADADGNLYFTDIPANRIYKMDAEGKIDVFFEPSGHCNGLMLRGRDLLACEMDGQVKAINLRTRKATPLATEYAGRRFNAPNDLVIDRAGGIYFTDPRFRAPTPWPQKVEAVYYLAANGKVTRLIEDLDAPNGVIMSTNEKNLYVVPSVDKKVMVYRILAPGKLSKGKVLCELQQKNPKDNRGGDGLTLDVKGNLYITTGIGIQVVSPSGKHLMTINVPEQPANCTFGGKGRKTLYITARTGLYSTEMEVAGHVFPGR